MKARDVRRLERSVWRWGIGRNPEDWGIGIAEACAIGEDVSVERRYLE